MKTENRKSTVNQNHSTNISMADRSVRYVLALTFSLFPVITQDPVTYWFLPIAAVWLMMTALVGWDPIYAVARSGFKRKNAMSNAAPQSAAARQPVSQGLFAKADAANEGASRKAA